MTELDRYQGAHAPVPAVAQPAAEAALLPANDVDGWVRVVGDISRLATQIANTEFVPRAMQGKPAAVAAAMLAGREMGIGPMTSLQNIHVIQGRPGQSALLMRALVQAKGHHIDFVEATDERCIIRGRRTNEEGWTEVEFTAAQAKRAKIDLGQYPADKLVARASARLCRRKFADVISGMGYSLEELADGFVPEDAGRDEPPTRRGATITREPAAPVTVTELTGGTPVPVDEEVADATAAPDGEQLVEPDPGERMRPEQQRKLFACIRDAEIEDRWVWASGLLGREITSYGQLSVADASVLIDALEQGLAALAGDPGGES